MAFTGPNDDETLPAQAATSGFKGPENEAIDPKQLVDDESFDPRSFAAEHPDQIDLATNVALERHKKPVTLKGVGHAIMSGGKSAWEGAKTVIPDMLGGIGTVLGNAETEMTSPSELDRARAYKENLAAEAGIEHNIGGLGKAIGNNAAKLYGKITGDAGVSSDDYFKQGFRDSVKDETERRRIASGDVREDETLFTKGIKAVADDMAENDAQNPIHLEPGESINPHTFGVADMSNANLRPDEVAIRKMESAANPINLVPLGVPGMGTVANKVAGGALKGVGAVLRVPAEVAAAALEKTKVGKVITGAGAPAAVIEAAMHPVLAAKIAAGMATAQGAKKLGELIGGAGDQLLNPKEFTTPMTQAALEAARTPGVNRLTNPAMNAEAGANAFRTTLQGAATGPIHIAPLAIAGTDADSGNYANEAAGMIGGGISIGAFGGATGGVMQDQRNRLVNEAGRQYRADGNGATYANADLSKVSNDTIAGLPETERDSINAAKGFFAGKKMRSGADAQIYVLPKDQFGAEVSRRSGESLENSSEQNGYADPSTGEVFINADGDHSASSILGHEGGGHLGVEIARKIIQDSGPIAAAKDVVSTVLPSLMKDGAPVPRFNDFITAYNKSLHGDKWEMPEKPDPQFLKSMAEEWVAEEARDQIGGRFEDFSVPESIRSAVTKKLGDHYNEWFGTTKSFDRNGIANVSGVVRDMLHDIAGQKPGETPKAEPEAAKPAKAPEASKEAKAPEPAAEPEAPSSNKVNSDARLKSVGIDPAESDALRDKVKAEAIEAEQKRRGKRGFSEDSREEVAKQAGDEHDAQVEALVKNLEDNDQVLGHNLQDGLLYNETNSENGGYTGWINRGDKAKTTSILSKSSPLADSVEPKPGEAVPVAKGDHAKEGYTAIEPLAGSVKPKTREELQAILDKPAVTVEDINARNKAQREIDAMGPKTPEEIKAEAQAKASEPIAMPEKTTYKGRPGPDGADQWEIKSLTDNEPRVGDIIVSRDGQIRMVSKPPKGGTIDTVRPFDSINSRGGVTFKDGDYKVAEVDYAKPGTEGPLADTPTGPVPAMRIVPAEGGRFKIVDPAGNNLKGQRTYATEAHAQRGIDRTGKGVDLGNGPGGDPDILNHIDEMGGIAPKTNTPEYDGMPDIKGSHTAILGGTESPDRVAENLFREGMLPDAHTDTLWDAIGNAIRARKSMKEAEATQKAEEARQKAEAKKNPQKPLEDVETTVKQDGQTQSKKNEPVLADTITRKPGDTNLDDTPKSPALRETDVAEIARKAEAAEKLKEEHLNKNKLKAGERVLTQKGQDAIAVAGINAVAEAHAETVPANYEGVRLRTNAQGDSWIGGRFNPDRPFDAFLLKTADLSKTAIQTLLALQAQIGQTVRINYRHAIHQGGEVTNESRGQSQKANTADMRAAGEGKWEDRDKHFIPLSVYFNKGSATKAPSITVHGASPEKLFRNFKAISGELERLGEKPPYPNVHSDAFIRDMQGGIENHRNGWKFDGSARVKSDAPDVSIPKASEDFVPHKIDSDKAEFINLLMGDESAQGEKRTAEQRIQRDLKRGLAVENKIPMVKTGEDAGEVNPLRKAINDLNGKIPVIDAETGKPKLDKDGNPVTTTWSRKNVENPLSEDIRPDLVNKIHPDIDNSDESIRPHGFQGDISSPFEKGQPNKLFVSSGFMPKSPLSDVSVMPKPRVKDLVRDSETLRDVANSNPLAKEGYGGLSAPRRRSVEAAMVRLVHDPEIFKAVVGRIPVDVMDHLRGGQFSSDGSLDNKAVDKVPLPGNSGLDVPVGIDITGDIVGVIAGAAAKVIRASKDLGGELEKGTVAKLAGDDRHEGTLIGKTSHANNKKPLEGVTVRDNSIYRAPGKAIDISEDTASLPKGASLAQDGGLWVARNKDGKLLAATGSRSGTIRQAIDKGEGKFMPLDEKQPDEFYSNLERIAKAKVQGRVDPEQLLKTLKNNGVKDDEISWTIGDLLDRAKKEGRKITPQELSEEITANKVQIKEVVKGSEFSEASKDELRKLIQDGIDHWDEDDLDEEEYPGHAKDARSAAENGEEALELLDKGDIKGAFELVKDNSSLETEYGDDPAWGAARKFVEKHEERGSEGDTKFSNYQLHGGENYREVLLTLPSKPLTFEEYKKQQAEEGVTNEETLKGWYKHLKPKDGFKSSHFDEPNILAHLRVNDRTTPDGTPMLFAEELQSDWHQKGRKDGYDNEAAFQKLLKQRDEAPDDSPQQEELQRQIDEMAKSGNKGVPDAPFKGEGWKRLGIKKLISLAVSEGKKAIGWTTGEQQAERYDLSKQISKVQYLTDRKTLIAYDKDGKKVMTEKNVEPDAIEDYIGKEPARKIIEANATEFKDSMTDKMEPYKEISGVDLKVGGEGMKGFYDRELVNIANDIGKRYGAKAQKTEIKAGDDGEKEVWTLTITPAMEKAVKESGQSMFMPSENSSSIKSKSNPLEDAETFRTRHKLAGKRVTVTRNPLGQFQPDKRKEKAMPLADTAIK